jgi:hypothetical protein
VSKAQALIRIPNDLTLRVLGNCIDVSNAAYVAGQNIWRFRCNASAAQKWQINTSDGTIRQNWNTSLCAAPASTAVDSDLRITTCNGSTLQKWTW